MMEEKKTFELISIASIPLIMTLGNSMLIPVLPTLEKELDISAFQSSLIITSYSVISIICIPIAGYLSDVIGRKKVIIPSLILTAIGGLVAGLSPLFFKDISYWLILLGRLLQGMGGSGAFPVVIPLVGDIFKNEKQVSSALGVLETSNTAGKVLSPILGSLFALISWHSPFLAIPLLCLISIVLVGGAVKAPKNQTSPPPFRTFIKGIGKIFKNNGKWLISVFIIGGVIMFVLFGTLFYLSKTLEKHYHIDGVRKGFIIAIPLFALSVASLWTGGKIGQNKILMKWLTFLGMFLLLIAMCLLCFNPPIRLFLFYLFLGSVGIGITLPCLDAFLTEGIDKENRGTITSLYSSMRYVGVGLGPPLFAALMKGSVFFMFLVAAGTALLAVFVSLWGIHPTPSKEKSSTEPSTN
ncbi:MFS transporter [Pullulanibacillus sp. KACC 23026]|uniref:MFS transporter n=1 Tax=Pullulanibacillus sp. KACC 23026 TaxID=3028315 RepID=UPI0023B18CBA|nr:MFS transporter [Pullulanibacillus sp. KACC 23026]WEG10874.1 MFS transporter [Pullulanibacillus sp. KACC 23026]